MIPNPYPSPRWLIDCDNTPTNTTDDGRNSGTFAWRGSLSNDRHAISSTPRWCNFFLYGLWCNFSAMWCISNKQCQYARGSMIYVSHLSKWIRQRFRKGHDSTLGTCAHPWLIFFFFWRLFWSSVVHRKRLGKPVWGCFHHVTFLQMIHTKTSVCSSAALTSCARGFRELNDAIAYKTSSRTSGEALPVDDNLWFSTAKMKPQCAVLCFRKWFLFLITFVKSGSGIRFRRVRISVLILNHFGFK